MLFVFKVSFFFTQTTLINRNIFSLSCWLISLVSLKCWINIALLGMSCDEIDKHKMKMEKKTPLVRTCSSLPSSRHGSMENLTKIPTNTIESQSTPHTPTPSQSSSLADISAQAALLQETLDNSLVMSDSQVSLVSMDIEGKTNKMLHVIDENNPSILTGTINFKKKSILRQSNSNSDTCLKRRVSLQDNQLN